MRHLVCHHRLQLRGAQVVEIRRVELHYAQNGNSSWTVVWNPHKAGSRGREHVTEAVDGFENHKNEKIINGFVYSRGVRKTSLP